MWQESEADLPAHYRVRAECLHLRLPHARFGGVRMGSAARFGPAGHREVATRLSARIGLDEDFYLH